MSIEQIIIRKCNWCNKEIDVNKNYITFPKFNLDFHRECTNNKIFLDVLYSLHIYDGYVEKYGDESTRVYININKLLNIKDYNAK